MSCNREPNTLDGIALSHQLIIRHGTGESYGLDGLASGGALGNCQCSSNNKLNSRMTVAVLVKIQQAHLPSALLMSASSSPIGSHKALSALFCAQTTSPFMYTTTPPRASALAVIRNSGRPFC